MKENERDRESESSLTVFANTQISKGTRLCDVAAGMSDGALRRRMQIQIEHDKLLLSTRYFARAYRNPFIAEVRIPHIISPTVEAAPRHVTSRIATDETFACA